MLVGESVATAVDPRQAVADLVDRLAAAGVRVLTGRAVLKAAGA